MNQNNNPLFGCGNSAAAGSDFAHRSCAIVRRSRATRTIRVTVHGGESLGFERSACRTQIRHDDCFPRNVQELVWRTIHDIWNGIIHRLRASIPRHANDGRMGIVDLVSQPKQFRSEKKEISMFWKKRESKHEFRFVGGPLDGYEQTMPFRPSPILAFPVDCNLLAALHGDAPPEVSQITSVAFYEGTEVGTRSWQFRFVRSTTPEEAEKTCHKQLRSDKGKLRT